MTVPTKETFATEVRFDRLQILWEVTLLGCLAAAFIIFVLGMVTASKGLEPIFAALLALALACLWTRRLLQKDRFTRAAWTYALGGVAAAGVLLSSVRPSDLTVLQIIPFTLPVIIFIVGLLLPPISSFMLAGVSALVVVIVPSIALGVLTTGIHQIFAIFLMFVSAGLAAQVTGELYQITEWALMNYQKERRTNDQLFEKRQELIRSLQRSEALSQKLRETNLELEVARAAAEEAKHFRGQFLANMSHELRTPLNAIIGFSETMLKFPLMYDNVPLPTTYNNDMSQIYSSGRQLLHVINDILDLAKVDAGKLEVHLQKVDPEPVILAAISTAKGLIGGRPIELKKTLPQPLPMLWTDETRLRQVLLNLYSNACKFTDEGAISLTVRETGEGVQFSVTDTGCGIAPEHHATIFEEFRQASTAGRDPRAGAGLGLTISRQLLTLMGGRIWVESEPGKGSTFHFLVQSYKGQDSSGADHAQPEPVVASAAPTPVKEVKEGQRS